MSKPATPKPKAPPATPSDDEGEAPHALLGQRCTAADATAANALPNAPQTTFDPLARGDVDLVVDHAAAITSQKAVLEANDSELKIDAMLAAARETQALLSLAERLQGSLEAVRAAAKRGSAEVGAFAVTIDGIARKAKSGSPLEKALGAFHSSHAVTKGVAQRTRSLKKTLEKKKTAK